MKLNLNTQKAIINLVTNISDINVTFYGHLVSKCKIISDPTISAPAGVNFDVDHYNLYINEEMFGKYSLSEQKAIIIHEMLHIIHGHVARRLNKKHQNWNIACDIAINQFISNLPEDGLLPEQFNFPKKLDAEKYYNLLEKDDNGDSNDSPDDGNDENKSTDDSEESQSNDNKFKDKSNEGSGGSKQTINKEENVQEGLMDPKKAHSRWEESNGDEMTAKEVAKAMLNEAAQKSRGNVPVDFTSLLKLLETTSQMNWKSILRNIITRYKSIKRPSIKKKNRRFIGREDVYGSIKNKKFKLLSIMDVSGSMDNKEIQKAIVELKEIVEKTHSDVMNIQVDTTVHSVDEFDIKKIKKDGFKRAAAGGTNIYAALEYAMKENYDFDAIIVITDGYIEPLSTWTHIPNAPFFWLITSDGEVPKNLPKRMKAFKLK